MNPLWDAAEAALALALDCLSDHCADYGRVLIETSTPVADCATLAISIGNARAYSGSCVGKLQLSSYLDINLIRCCDPVGTLSSEGGYTPPSAESIQAAAACVARDAWAIYECFVCTGCEVIGAVPNVTACCDDKTGAPEIIWGYANGGCRSAVVRIPLIFTTCCIPAPPNPVSVSFAGTQGCERTSINGAGFENVNRLQLVGTFGTIDYYDPAGPDVALNPVTSSAFSWNPTIINFTDTQLAGETISSMKMWGVGNTPFYGSFPYDAGFITPCP